ncbi:MAG: pyruvate dehydrogenase (acetyl-transferring) E1 component subunit alpha [Desulfotignum sp.]|nr:pyruvate dehydrogenase (acetyl-transferring) E1 component subunit alpha [Desulfotignum sp.]
MPLKIIDEFNIQQLLILDETGKVDKDLEPDISDDDLKKLYQAMILSRMADARMLNLQRQGRIGTIPVNKGQEASSCAPILALKDTDWFVGSYRELGARLMRGETLENSLLLFNGWEEGNVNENNDRTLPISIVLASQLPHAVGLAYGSRYKGEKDTVVLAMFGDGATSEGDFHEALNFAGVLNAPVIFLCQNNQYAISTPLKIQTKSRTIAQKAIAYGIPGIQVDGNDALAVYQATREAVDRARAGEGPTLIEAVTFRMLMHTTADDPTRYRSDDEVTAWEVRDPLTRFRKYLTDKGIWDEKSQEGLEGDCKQQIDDAVKAFESRKPFASDAPFDHVFGTREPLIEAQRARFLEKREKEGDHGED